jgi:hypothetical protein
MGHARASVTWDYFKPWKRWTTYRASLQRLSYPVDLVNWAPALPDETSPAAVDAEKIQRVVDRLHLAHLSKPDCDVMGDALQFPLTVILSLSQHLD